MDSYHLFVSEISNDAAETNFKGKYFVSNQSNDKISEVKMVIYLAA